MKRSRSRPLPPLAGGQDALSVLTSIQEQLSKGQNPGTPADAKAAADAAAIAAAAQNPDAALSPAAQQIAAAAAGAETPEQELARLRKEASERATAEAVQQLAATTAAQIQMDQAAQSAAVQKMFVDQVQNLVNGEGTTDPVLLNALKNLRAPSRMVSGTPDQAYLDQVLKAAGGMHVQDPGSLRAGDDVGVKEFMDSKSFAWFMSAIHRSQKGMAKDFELKALAESTDSAGGYLVPPEWMDDILGLLRAATVVNAANPRRMPIGKLVNQVSVSTGATAYWGTENAATTPSEPSFGEAPILSPKFLTALVPVSNHLLRDTSRTGLADAEETVRADLIEVMSLAQDLGFLQGSGNSGQPKGLKNITGVTNLTTPLGIATDGDYFDDDLARNMIAEFRKLNANGLRLAWFFNPVLINQLEGLKDNEGRYLLETKQLVVNPDQRTGSLWGIPFYTTTQVPTNITRGATTTTTYVLLVNMPEVIIGESRDLSIDTSSEASYTTDGGTTWVSAYQNRQTLFRAEFVGDITHRRPSQIMLLEGIKTV